MRFFLKSLSGDYGKEDETVGEVSVDFPPFVDAETEEILKQEVIEKANNVCGGRVGWSYIQPDTAL